MKLFGICLLKNEADIIEFSLTQNARHFDKIFVYDNASTDDSWQIVRHLAEHDKKIIPVRSDATPYTDGLRARIFEQYRHAASDADWWCKLDADEIYPGDPRDFLAAVPPNHHVVWSASCQFYLTTADCEKYATDDTKKKSTHGKTYRSTSSATTARRAFFVIVNGCTGKRRPPGRST